VNASCIVSFKLRSWMTRFSRLLAPAIASCDCMVLALLAVAMRFQRQISRRDAVSAAGFLVALEVITIPSFQMSTGIASSHESVASVPLAIPERHEQQRALYKTRSLLESRPSCLRSYFTPEIQIRISELP
jgi:hypothetical protein